MQAMRTALALLLTLGLAAASATAASALSERAYVRAANKICAARAVRLAKLPHISLKKSTPKQLARRLERVLAVYRPGYRQLRALRPPRSFSFLVPRWLRYENVRMGLWSKARHAAARRELGKARSYVHRSNVYGRFAAEISTGLDIEHCE